MKRVTFEIHRVSHRSWRLTRHRTPKFSAYWWGPFYLNVTHRVP